MLSSNRDKFQAVEKKVGKSLSFLSPDSWTFLSLIAAACAAVFLSLNNYLAGALLFALAALCDAVDGPVARFTDKATKKGAYVDTIIDRYVEFFVIAGLFFASLPAFVIDAKLWLLLYLFGSMMTTYAKAAAKEKDLVKEEMTAGIMGRAERLILLFVGLVLAAINPAYLTDIIIILAALTNITALQRVGRALG